MYYILRVVIFTSTRSMHKCTLSRGVKSAVTKENNETDFNSKLFLFVFMKFSVTGYQARTQTGVLEVQTPPEIQENN